MEDFKGLDHIIGEQLKAIRVERGISQEKLALETGLDRSYISMLERGRRNPTLVVLFRICSALQLRPEEFIQSIAEAYESR